MDVREHTAPAEQITLGLIKGVFCPKLRCGEQNKLEKYGGIMWGVHLKLRNGESTVQDTQEAQKAVALLSCLSKPYL